MSKRKKTDIVRILMYSHMGNGRGGGQTVFRKICERLDERFEVIRLFRDTSGQASAGRIRRGKNGNWYIDLPPPSSWSSFLNPKYVLRFAISFIRLAIFIYKVKPNVVNFHYLSTTLIHFSVLKTVFKYKLVLSCHGGDVKGVRNLITVLESIILRPITRITCVSREIAESLQEQVRGDYLVSVIHNGINFEFWQSSAYHTSRSRPKQLISVGALREIKGQDVLIRAFAKVIDSHPGVTLRLVGDGPKRSEYEALANDLSVSNSVSFSGWLSTEKVRVALRNASLFVFPSRWEGFGIALLEAMATGLPVVATDTGGIPEITEGTNALLLPPDSPSALADAIQRALEDDKWYEAATHKSVERAAQFDWSGTLNQYERILVQ